ncbi:ParB/RepB/Spo0J family partition protein [Streptomyces lavendulae]|uniref:ParB/RepB/Spo0J family partition protein n=1 Tax=Streptomyces lavendulae TaxID=1914 RepID=UPI0031E52108
MAHDEFDDFFPDDDTPVVDTRADGRLLRVPLNRLAPNRVNPRTDFGTTDELLDLGKSLRRRQIQACPAVSRSAYLKLWPDHAEHFGNVDYVLVTGERRYRGASAAGSPTLNCVVDDGVAKDRRTFMEAVVSENVDRQNFNAVEEAYAVRALVAEFGSNRAVADHFERVEGWVTQRILLTHLAPEVQDLVKTKSMPLDAARSLGKLARDGAWSSAQQLDWWRSEKEQRTAASAKRSAVRKAAKASASATEHQEAKATPAAQKTAAGPSVPGQAHPGTDSSEVEGLPKPKKFPYLDGVEAAGHLISKMPPTEFTKMLAILNRHAASQEAVLAG